MKPYKILFDLSPCLDKSQALSHRDTCNLFKILSGNPQLHVDGLLYSHDRNLFGRHHPPQTRAEKIEQGTYFFHDAFRHEMFLLTKWLSKAKVERFFRRTKNQYDLCHLDSLFEEVIWRNIFSDYLVSQHKPAVMLNQFYSTPMTLKTLSSINTDGYELAIFPEVSSIKVSDKTIKVVCFRYPIEMMDPDFVSRSLSNQFSRDLKQASLDSYFLCDTEVSRTKLLDYFPQMEDKSCVIPHSVSFYHERRQNWEKLKFIVSARLSAHLLNQRQRHNVRAMLDKLDSFSYVLSVGPLTKEKNLISLIHSFEKLNFEYNRGLKLLLVTESDSCTQEIQHALQSHIELNDIIILSNLTDSEQSYLYSHAAFFITTAFAEYTNTDVLTAMHYGCPTLVSDISVNRSQWGDASLYCDPYSEKSISRQMTRLLYTSDAEQVKNELIEKGLQHVKSFSENKRSEQWMMLCEKIITQKVSV